MALAYVAAVGRSLPTRPSGDSRCAGLPAPARDSVCMDASGAAVPGEPFRLAVAVRDRSFVPVRDAEVVAQITGPSGDVTDLRLALAAADTGTYAAGFTPPQGRHLPRAGARATGQFGIGSRGQLDPGGRRRSRARRSASQRGCAPPPGDARAAGDIWRPTRSVSCRPCYRRGSADPPPPGRRDLGTTAGRSASWFCCCVPSGCCAGARGCVEPSG